MPQSDAKNTLKRTATAGGAIILTSTVRSYLSYSHHSFFI